MLLDSRRLKWPPDWSALFGRSAPLVLEIGFGNGQFLVDLAVRYPDVNVLGIEISLPSVKRAISRARQAKVQNVRVLNCGVQYGLWALSRPGSLHAVYINFPDPWPKLNHHHRRVINERFLHLLATRVPAGAHLNIATDHADYATAITKSLHNTPYFASRLNTPFVTEDNERIRTKYELLALAAGRTCHYYHWQRNQTVTPNDFAIPPELPMPHVILRTSMTLPDIQARFEPSAWSHEMTRVRFIQLYQAAHHDTLLVDAYINEEPMKQRLGLVIRQRSDNEIIIGLHELGFPRPTPGVHRAIDFLASWLTRLEEDVLLVHSNLNL